MENRDEKLWKQAKERIGFKRHLTSYILVNILLWLIWYFSTSPYYTGFPWPVFVMLGWGVGIVSHYIRAYVNNGDDAVQKEYDKLKNKRG